MTQGRYVRSVAGDMDLEQIYSEDILGTMERKELTQGRKKVWEKRFQWALLPCVLLLLAEACFPQRLGRKSGVKAGRSLICLAIAMGLMTPGLARAQFWTSPVKQGMQAWNDNHRITSYNVCYTKLLRLWGKYSFPYIPNGNPKRRIACFMKYRVWIHGAIDSDLTT